MMREYMAWQRVALVLLVACATCATTPAEALITYTQAEWTVGIGGTVNGFYVHSTQEDTDADTGETTKTTQSSVQNGLLPGWINFVITTQQEGLDIKAHLGFAPGINSNSQIVGLPSGANAELADAFAKVDSRNVYLQFGNDKMGSLKLGRDIGLFMQNPIFGDMTLLGVGGTVRASEPYNTSFGNIGHGYLYAGFQPQITYATPNLNGFSLSAGVFNPSFYDTTEGRLGEEKKVPQLQGLAAYEWQREDSWAAKAWIAGVYNKTAGDGGQTATGYEGGVKVGFGPAELLLSGFMSKGLSISTIGAQFLVIPDADGDELKSDGYFAQFTYKVIPDLKLGVNYGRNRDKNLTAEGDAKRRAVTLGAYYKLTQSLTLVGEYVNEKADNILGGSGVLSEQKVSAVNVGAILFF